MRVIEGRGFLLRCGSDSPFAGWVTARRLDARASVETAPWMMLQPLAELAGLLPGGLALLWDLPEPSFPGLPREVRASLWSALGHLPGLSLHVEDGAFAEHLDGPLAAWFHSPAPPTGPMGQAWRQGWIGWVPRPVSGWTLPGLGRVQGQHKAQDETPFGFLWGEIILPLGALKETAAGDLVPLLGDTQAGIERNLSLRMSARAWPEAFPFQRRRTGWRIAVLGGREYLSAGGTWDDAAARLQALAADLSAALKCPVLPGTCHDPEAASLLGHQAMREGHPWRYSLPIPPASPTFTPGLGADPREAAPLESRAACPGPLGPILSHPPVAWLRVPAVPSEAGAEAFLRGLHPAPAVRWIPPSVAPPGPFSQEKPWAPASAFTPLADVTQALQPSLFGDLDGGAEGPRND